MQSLLRFIVRFYGFFLFVVLEVFCGLIISTESNFHRASFFSSANYLIGNFYNSTSDIADYFQLKEANEQLLSENAKLKAALKSAHYNKSFKVGLVRNVASEQLYTFIPAKVINNSISSLTNYLTLDKGSIQEVKAEMGVICDKGIIGLTKTVSNHYTSVISLLHKDLKVSAKFKKNNYFGSVEWNGKKHTIVQLHDIPQHVNIQVGDTIVTSGYSTFFPADIPIGAVSNFELIEGTNFYDIDVQLFADLQSIEYIYIVNHLKKEELEELSSKEENE